MPARQGELEARSSARAFRDDPDLASVRFENALDDQGHPADTGQAPVEIRQPSVSRGGMSSWIGELRIDHGGLSRRGSSGP